MTESNRTREGPVGPLRRSSRRAAVAHVDPKDVARRRWLIAGAAVAIAGVLGAYVWITSGRPPGGPVAELPRFSAAMDGRDVDAMLQLWDPGADPAATRQELSGLFEQVGGVGMTPRVEPPRVRIVDARTYRGLHRLGEVDLQTTWVWDGERFRLSGLALAQ